MRRTLTVLAVAVAMLGLGAGSAQADLPVIWNGVYGYAHTSPSASPPGANDWSCKPSAAHPRPVVLVHGTFADMSNSWQAISPLLKNNGYCVFALNYGDYNGSGAIGVYGVDDIPTSAAELNAFVDKVRAATGAAEVDLVGHSQGGMMPRYYLKYLGGLFILSNFFPGANQFTGALCPACEQQRVDSAFITNLNAGGETVPGVA